MSKTFGPNTGEPDYLYQRFADYLAATITSEILRPGARFPGERDLAAEHGVSVGTVRRATAVLRDRGLVVTLPAKGTYVATRQRDHDSGEKSIEETLAAARSLPSGDEMIIDDLTDEEQRRFYEAIEDT